MEKIYLFSVINFNLSFGYQNGDIGT